MRLHLEHGPDQAVMVVSDAGWRTEIRGNPLVGSTFTGDELDRLVAALPPTVNMSGLFAEETIHLRPGDAVVVRSLLEREEDLRRRLRSSLLRRPWRDR